MTTFPTWLTGPNGERRVFERAEDVPEGWVHGLHPSVRHFATLPKPVAAMTEFRGELIVAHEDGTASVVTAGGEVEPLEPAPKPKKPGRRR